MPTIKSIRASLARVDNQAAGLDQARPDGARFWLAAIADSLDDAIIGCDLDRVITSWNKTAETMFGYAAAEVVGQPITRIIPPDRVDDEASIVRRIDRGEKVIHLDTIRQCKDGRSIPVSMTISAIRDDHGRIIGISNTVRDLSGSQREDLDLKRREALLRSILDSLPDALAVIDKHGLIHSLNVAAARLFGYSSLEMMGQNISLLLPTSDRAEHIGHLLGYRPTGARPIVGFGQRQNKTQFPMELSIGEIDLAGTRVLTAVVHDLTEAAERERGLRAANSELERQARNLVSARDVAERSNSAKSRFLAGMSHELRTPLNSMIGYAQLLRVDGELNVAQTKRVAAMLGAGKHLLQMIACVLDLSEIEAEHIELQSVELDALTVATGCVELVRPAAEAKRLALSIAVTPGVRHELISDPARLRQVLLNLLGNAVKFTNQGGVELRLRPGADASVLRIEVVDTGPGIPVAQRRRLFREFDRIDAEGAHTGEGAGMGLALSSRLVTLLGGCLGHHENPGGGSVFWLEFPMEAAAGPAGGVVRTASDAGPPSVTLHVLVADDVAMNRDIAGSFLRAAGHKVTLVEGGAEAVAAVEAANFDVVLMDVRMPEMDGLEATRRIRALEGARGRVPIVALTARAFTEQVAECREAGMDSHLPKPFDPDTLLAAVLRAFAAGPTNGEALVAAPGAVAAKQVMPVLGSELLVCNPSAFERTAFYLAPDAVSSYLDAISQRGQNLLRDLRAPDALIQAGDELAEAAHTIAGSAGMFGFERLTTIGRRFERAVQAGAADAPSLADALEAALEVTLQAIHDRTLVLLDA